MVQFTRNTYPAGYLFSHKVQSNGVSPSVAMQFISKISGTPLPSKNLTHDVPCICVSSCVEAVSVVSNGVAAAGASTSGAAATGAFCGSGNVPPFTY